MTCTEWTYLNNVAEKFYTECEAIRFPSSKSPAKTLQATAQDWQECYRVYQVCYQSDAFLLVRATDTIPWLTSCKRRDRSLPAVFSSDRVTSTSSEKRVSWYSDHSVHRTSSWLRCTIRASQVLLSEGISASIFKFVRRALLYNIRMTLISKRRNPMIQISF